LAGRGVSAFARSARSDLAAIVILTLALGIGHPRQFFRVDAVLLARFLSESGKNHAPCGRRLPTATQMNMSDPNFDDFLAQNNTFSSLAAYGFDDVHIRRQRAVRVNIAVSPATSLKRWASSLFAVALSPRTSSACMARRRMIVSLAIGSDISEVQRISPIVATWRWRRSLSVIGVMPAGFGFSFGVAAWIPRELDSETPSRTAHNWRGLGRVRMGSPWLKGAVNLSAMLAALKSGTERG